MFHTYGLYSLVFTDLGYLVTTGLGLHQGLGALVTCPCQVDSDGYFLLGVSFKSLAA